MYYEEVTDETAKTNTTAERGSETTPKAVNEEGSNSSADKQYQFSKVKTYGMLTRAFFQLAIQLCLLQTFYHGGKSGVNNGIISVIFSVGVLFTAVIFYFLYGQKLTYYDLVGGLFIIGCVALIGAGGTGHGADTSSGLNQEEKDLNLLLAIIMAIVTGLVFALNSLSIQFCTSRGCGVAQANMDGMFVMFLIMLPGFLAVHLGENPSPYGWSEMIIATAILVTQVFGIISLAVGLANGTAGPVQAIENQKTTVQTVLETAVQAHLPSGMQIGGLICGIVGVTVIVCQKKKKAE